MKRVFVSQGLRGTLQLAKPRVACTCPTCGEWLGATLNGCTLTLDASIFTHHRTCDFTRICDTLTGAARELRNLWEDN